MNLIIELTPEDAITVLKGLNLTDVIVKTTMQTTDTIVEVPAPEQLRKESLEIAEETVANLDDKLEATTEEATYSETSKNQDTLGEDFEKTVSSGGAPWTMLK